MKNLIKVSLVVIILVGCGSNNSIVDENITDSNLTDENLTDSNLTDENLTEIREIVMQIGTIYEVSSGDKVYQETNNSKLEIIYADENNITSVELLEGNATITSHLQIP